MAGTLREQLVGEVERMIADRRFLTLRERVHVAMVGTRQVRGPRARSQAISPTHARYPHRVAAGTGAVLAVLDPAQFAAAEFDRVVFVVANEVVASYYDLADKTESGLEFVPIVHGRPELGGVLSQAAIMAGLSDGRESNPV